MWFLYMRKSCKSSLPPALKCRKFRMSDGDPSTSISMVWRTKVPASWEKRYCEEEGSFPWEQILKAHLSIKYIVWDGKIKRSLYRGASSGDEALQKAKTQFWCKLNDPPFESLKIEEYADMNIDKDIDRNPVIDPDISLDFEKRRGDDDDIIDEGENDESSES
ncbi:hypothetical protein MKX03_037286 [Papaver bracteatum]|nr:hypothetical protein MKX03_037286 [Papaver bracteatum]